MNINPVCWEQVVHSNIFNGTNQSLGENLIVSIGGVLTPPEEIMITRTINIGFDLVDKTVANIDGKMIVKTAAIAVGVLALGYGTYCLGSKLKSMYNNCFQPKIKVSANAFDETAQKIIIVFRDGSQTEFSALSGNGLINNTKEIVGILTV